MDASERDNVEMNDMEVKRNGITNGKVIHDSLEYEPSGWLEVSLTRVGSSTEQFFKNNASAMKTVSAFIFNGLVVGYFIGCWYYWAYFITNTVLRMIQVHTCFHARRRLAIVCWRVDYIRVAENHNADGLHPSRIGFNVPSAGAQVFPLDGIGRLGHDPPRGSVRIGGC
ncbi:hypothetical protein evm_003429 [Chilo suppressalis]|nr:hypothetical protein evm_003429 [Chilo suppressalis]